MKVIPYKLVLILTLFAAQLTAQKKDFKEEFKVNSDVVIDINTRHSDIEIETWNKDKVVVEAFMVVDGEEVTEEMRDNFYNKWDFNAYGNSSKITIKSRTNSFIDINAFDFNAPNYSFYTGDLADLTLGSLDILDSIDFVLPDDAIVIPEVKLPPMPPLPPLPPLPSEFDFEAYKKDKSYLERWKEENKDKIGKNAKVTIGKNSISIKSDDADITMLKEKEKYQKELEKARQLYEKERYKAREEYQRARVKLLKEKKEFYKKRKEEYKASIKKYAQERKEIQELLKKRSKLKVKRLIKIKAPKNAKFNMDVKYGALSFPK
ncbi:hypothetical protein ACOSP6_06555 [Tenacibaculum sp. MEBiC06402]|uniref:hypothetical protein n=1 Tax=unclassified Tenacibaculum TaxID=2635139 RepID=UPI003B9B079B